MKKKEIITLVLIAVLANSCIKAPNVKPGVQTMVSGQFYDSFNQEGYANAVINVGEYESHFAGEFGVQYTLVGYRGSATTDVNGNYSITFTASGNGNTYFLEYNSIPQNISVNPTTTSTGGYTYYGRSEQIQNVGSSVTYNFDVFKQYFMQTRIIVKNNPAPPLWMSTGGPQFLISCGCNDVYGINNDTTVNIGIKKNTGGFYLYFGINAPVTNKTLSNSPVIFINPVVNKDTIQGGTYTLYPATFK